MENVNQYIEEFLDYYCWLPHSPEYAVMLKGPWGCGKSWFVNQYSNKMKDQNKKLIYVSLYGVGSFSEIENIFFQQLHPVLSSKGMALTSKILKGALRATLKIDLDGDKHDDLSINSQIPDISIPDYLKNTDGHLLIFDDLERCCINVNDVLGYINHFVEHQGYKAIIIANEDEIIKREQNNNIEVSYLKIKEKLIGKTFKIEPDAEKALDDFLTKLTDEKARTFIENNRAIIKQLYDISKYENLRHLKQALWDFERIFIVLPEKAYDKKELLQHLLKLLFALSFEIKSGNITALDISKIQAVYMSRLFKNSDDSVDNPIKNIIDKYITIIGLDDLLLEARIWEDIFDKGKIEKHLIEESLFKSSYFKDDNMPSWVKLWHFYNLTDDEFENVLSIVENELHEKVYQEVGIVLHVYGILLSLSQMNLYKKSVSEIDVFVREYIDTLKISGKIPVKARPFLSFMDRKAWGGLGFFSKDTEEFKNMYQYIHDVMSMAETSKMPEAAKEVLEIMVNDTDKFYRMVTLSNTEDQIYCEVPIFSYISPSEFVDAFLLLKPDSKYTVAYAIERRYEIPQFNHNIISDYEVITQIRALLADKQKELAGKVSGHIIGVIIDNHIDKALSKLGEAREAHHELVSTPA